jgi:hypothetical protein
MSVQAARLLDGALRVAALLAVMASVAIDARRPHGRPEPGRVAVACLVLFAAVAVVAAMALNVLGLTVGASSSCCMGELRALGSWADTRIGEGSTRAACGTVWLQVSGWPRPLWATEGGWLHAVLPSKLPGRYPGASQSSGRDVGR